MKINLTEILILTATAGAVYWFLTRKGGAVVTKAPTASAILADQRTQAEKDFALSLGDFAG